MLATTLSFQNLHLHGELFVNLLKARRQAFIVQQKWDLPEAEGMEYDQYDTPASRWVAVHENGKVLAGIRLTPTISKCGIYSYMIRDAQAGILESIPSNLLYDEAPVDPLIWESSRVFVCHTVTSRNRMRVQATLMSEMIAAAQDLGAQQVLGLVPAVWSRWVGRLGIEAQPAGPVFQIDKDSNQVARLDLSTTKELIQRKREGKQLKSVAMTA